MTITKMVFSMFLNFLLDTVSESDFRRTIIKDIASIDSTQEMDNLVQVVPRTSKGEPRILYYLLSNELKVRYTLNLNLS